MYIHYNPNPRGLRVGDCAVRAASKAAGETWGSAYAALCALGYDCGDMPNANHVWGRTCMSADLRATPCRILVQFAIPSRISAANIRAGCTSSASATTLCVP